MSAQAACPVIPSQCSPRSKYPWGAHWVVRRSVAEVSTRSVDGGIVVTPVPPPSVKEVARSAGWRDVDPPHPRRSSVGADAHIRPPRPQARNSKASLVQREVGLSKGTFRAPARGTFALGGKSTQKRRSNLRFENPFARLHPPRIMLKRTTRTLCCANFP